MPDQPLVFTVIGGVVTFVGSVVVVVLNVAKAKKLGAETRKLDADALRTQAESERIRAETQKIAAETLQITYEGRKSLAEVEKLRAEAGKLRAETRNLRDARRKAKTLVIAGAVLAAISFTGAAKAAWILWVRPSEGVSGDGQQVSPRTGLPTAGTPASTSSQKKYLVPQFRSPSSPEGPPSPTVAPSVRARAINGCTDFEDGTTGASDMSRYIDLGGSLPVADQRCLRVKQGQTVIFGGFFMTHPLVAAGGDSPAIAARTGTIATAEDYEVTFSTVGTFGFTCSAHPAEAGAIHVIP